MNSRQLQYAILLSQELNFSTVAEKLNITQPALSKQILNLESELGVKLFDRSCSPIALTPAGVYFIREAKEILYKEEQLVRSMENFKSGDAGELVIGITPFRSSYLITDVIKEVKKAFPKITVRLNEAGSEILRKEVAEGKYDFAVVNLPVDDSILDVKTLESDELVLAVPKAIQTNFNSNNAIDFEECKDIPFVVVGKTQEMRQLFDKLCASSQFNPIIAAEVVGLTTAWEVASSGIGATILPKQFVEQKNKNGDMMTFKIKNDHYLRQPAIVTRKDQYISNAAEYAIKLLTK